jgi:hypothetical protein
MFTAFTKRAITNKLFSSDLGDVSLADIHRLHVADEGLHYIPNSSLLTIARQFRGDVDIIHHRQPRSEEVVFEDGSHPNEDVVQYIVGQCALENRRITIWSSSTHTFFHELYHACYHLYRQPYDQKEQRMWEWEAEYSAFALTLLLNGYDCKFSPYYIRKSWKFEDYDLSVEFFNEHEHLWRYIEQVYSLIKTNPQLLVGNL